MFAEIRNDYASGPLFDGSDIDEEGYLGYISIDGWKSDRDDEEGQVIAAVMITPHGDVVVDWHDNGARLNEATLSAISEAKARLQSAFRDWETESRKAHSLQYIPHERHPCVDFRAELEKAGDETSILVIRLDYATGSDDDGYLIYKIYRALGKSMDDTIELAKKAADVGYNNWNEHGCGDKSPAFVTSSCDDTVDVFIEHSFKESGIRFELCTYDLRTLNV